jgi:hypothetical protein
LIKGILVIGYPEVSHNVKYETRIKSTRISLLAVCALAIWMLVAVYV